MQKIYFPANRLSFPYSTFRHLHSSTPRNTGNHNIYGGISFWYHCPTSIVPIAHFRQNTDGVDEEGVRNHRIFCGELLQSRTWTCHLRAGIWDCVRKD